MDPFLIALIAVGVFEIILFIWLIRMEQRLKLLFRGSKAKNLEEHFQKLTEEVEKFSSAEHDLYAKLAQTDARVKKSIRNIETIRFNPFPGEGSNQSFASALVNDEGNGIIISSLYSRERMSIFAKPIKNGSSEHELTEEEREVLTRSYKN
jgi:hypothetical protein